VRSSQSRPIRDRSARNRILGNILRKASSPIGLRSRTCLQALAGRRKASPGGLPLSSSEKSSDVVVRGIAQFPSLTSVTLEEEAVCDLVLGAIASRCPKLRHLNLTCQGIQEPSSSGAL